MDIFGSPNVDAAAGHFPIVRLMGWEIVRKYVLNNGLEKYQLELVFDKLYYTVNVTSTSFQVSETFNGARSV